LNVDGDDMKMKKMRTIASFLWICSWKC